MNGNTNADGNHSTATTTFSNVEECFFIAHTQLLLIMPTAVTQNCLFSSKVTLPNPVWKEQHLFLYKNIQVTKKKMSRDHWSRYKNSRLYHRVLGQSTKNRVTPYADHAFINRCSMNVSKTLLTTIEDLTISLLFSFYFYFSLAVDTFAWRKASKRKLYWWNFPKCSCILRKSEKKAAFRIAFSMKF